MLLCSTPTASVVLNLAELEGTGQKTAANAILVATVLSLLTLPLTSLLFEVL